MAKATCVAALPHTQVPWHTLASPQVTLHAWPGAHTTALSVHVPSVQSITQSSRGAHVMLPLSPKAAQRSGIVGEALGNAVGDAVDGEPLGLAVEGLGVGEKEGCLVHACVLHPRASRASSWCEHAAPPQDAMVVTV